MADGPHQIADYRSHGAYVVLGMLGAAGLILIALAAIGALLGAGAPRSDGLMVDDEWPRVAIGEHAWRLSRSMMVPLAYHV